MRADVLIVDDTPANLRLLSNMLAEHGYKVRSVISGQMALMAARSAAPDLILLDINMPEMNGYEVCRQLKAEAATQSIPVIFISALDETVDKVKAFASGGVDYVTKPLQLEEVLARVETQITLYRQRQELQERYDQIQQLQRQLVEQAKMAALGGLVAGIAHEINTPIGVGVTAASLLAQKTAALQSLYESDAMKRSDLDRFLDVATQSSYLILANLNRAAELIQSFKQVAVDQSAENKRVFAVKPYLEEVLVNLGPRLKQTKHTVQVTGDDVTVESYPGALSQIATNLVMNSLTHAYEEGQAGRMVFEVRRQDGCLILHYSDDGRGIAPEHLPMIFEPFFTTRRGRGGSGLGLHIVYNLVTQKLSGAIHCQSTPGQGTTFVLELPDVLE